MDLAGSGTGAKAAELVQRHMTFLDDRCQYAAELCTLATVPKVPRSFSLAFLRVFCRACVLFAEASLAELVGTVLSQLCPGVSMSCQKWTI
eukprot:935380-Amphidinium_carterae.1